MNRRQTACLRPAPRLAGSVLLSLVGAACYSGRVPESATPAPPPAAQAAPAAPAATAPATPAPACGPSCDLSYFAGADLTPKAPVPHLRPAEEARKIILQPGYRLDPVLADPDIKQPAAISFDGDGRMYVVELRSFMLNGDAKDELAPISRISRWEDRDDDGVYESGTVFVDSLVFPRFAMPLTDGVILAKESNADELWKYTDTNGDGKADRKELFTTGYGRSGTVGHQESHLTWAMDNWLYSTYNTVRIRWTPNGVLREPIAASGGSWGVGQDDYGKLWFQGGASGLPAYFQFPIVYGSFNHPQQLDPGLRTPWGAPVGTADPQGGMAIVRTPGGSLKSTTAGAGANVYRGDRLPAELRGDYFYGEEVARILRRVHPETTEGLTRVRNVYEGQETEFIRSMDPLFRPVDNKTAPDGTIYIVDMYHGLIEEGEWSQPGSYLRAKIEQYQLDRAVNYGRVWRLTYDGMERDRTRPRMYQETAQQLVTHLAHPNGWWRDMAQQQLVLRQDRSVAPGLRTMARTHRNQLARIHALWTLEGLGSLDAALARELMKDPDAKIRAQAIRASETLYKGGDRSFAADYRTLASDASTDVAIQAVLTLNTLKVPEAATVIRAVQASNQAAGMQHVATQILATPANAGAGGGAGQRTPAENVLLARGQAIFQEACSECHGDTGMGTPVGDGLTLAPALAGNLDVQAHPEFVLRTLLHGLTGPVNGRSYPGGLMVPQRQPDDWIAAVASYVRTRLTNTATMVSPAEVARVRAATAGKTTPYRYDELRTTVPAALTATAAWKATASHNALVLVGGTASAMGAFTLEGWTTGVPQQPGMWFQVELPAPVALSSIVFSSRAQPAAPGPRAANAPPPPLAYPVGYRVDVSSDGASWRPVAEGQGSGSATVISFDPVQARFVRLTQTAATENAPPWSMHLMRLYESRAAR